MKELNIKVPASTSETNVKVVIPDPVLTVVQTPLLVDQDPDSVSVVQGKASATAVQPDPTYVLSGGTVPPVEPPAPVGGSAVFAITKGPLNAPGLESWHGWDTATGLPNPSSRYYRFTWKELQNGENSYTWDAFDSQVRAAIAKGQQFSCGIMAVYIGNKSATAVRYNNAYSCIPTYVMAKGMKYWVKQTGDAGYIVPNWNDEIYLTEHKKLLVALNKHVDDMGWQDVIGYIDIRGYGNWGEWHSAYIFDDVKNYPAGTDATDATKMRIIKDHFDAFPNHRLVLLMSALDANMWANTRNSEAVGRYALGLKNNRGGAGWRRDNWGLIERYDNYFNNTNPLWSLFKDRWMTAHVVGEPNNGETEYGGSAPMWALRSQMTGLHVSLIGNGNMNGNQTLPATWNKNFVDAALAVGHKLTIASGSYKDGTLNINWSNPGVANVLENAKVYAVVAGKEYPLTASVIERNGSWTTTDKVSLPNGDLSIVVRSSYRSVPVGWTGKVATIK